MSNQFVVYKLVPSKTRPNKTDKLPVHPTTLGVCNAHTTSAWVDYDTAKAVVEQQGEGYGIGYVFTDDDPFFFIDIDDCLIDGQWSERAVELCNLFQGAYIEISSSGKGLHIIGSYTDIMEHGCTNHPIGLEFYHTERFVALTGKSSSGSWGHDCTLLLPWLVNTYFPPKANVRDSEWSDQPSPEWSGPDDDNVLIEKMLKSKSGVGTFDKTKASFSDLWTANEPILALNYPTLNEVDAFDRSAADSALFAHLAFWTGNNHTRMERIARQSGLYREKWDYHKKYIPTSVINAVNRQTKVYRDKKAPPKPRTDEPINLSNTMRVSAELISGDMFMGASQQVEHFKGCVYVRSHHKVLIPDGSLLDQGQFRATYGGYDFTMDSCNEKITKNAWEALTESKAVRFPRVTDTCFRPELESGSVIEEEGKSLVNSYVPIQTPSFNTGIDPFLHHLSLLYPNERDRTILLSYMAACVQYKGVKLQWCPLLQGVEGNGKTLLINAVSNAVGHRYTHLPNASDLGGNGAKFNAWIEGKLFIGIEEIYVSDRREITEALKPLITNPRIEIQAKGGNQYTGDNRANFIMCSNHKDALMIKLDGRRYCVLYSNQQTKADMVRDGMTPTYFYQLYQWCKQGGYAGITYFLNNYQIPDEFNPATLCNVAPTTTSTNEAIELSLGSVEHMVMEAIDEDRAGFMGGWVSSTALDKLLVANRSDRKVPVNKRRELMESLGYIYHPALRNGRVNNPVVAEGSKPKLYIHKNSPMLNIRYPAEVLSQYESAQGYLSLFNNNQSVSKTL